MSATVGTVLGALTGGGLLSRELGRALAEACSGASLVQALDGIARRTSLSPLSRFVDGVAIAVERGTWPAFCASSPGNCAAP